MSKTKTLFIGAGSFAVPILNQLLDSDFIDVVGVVTQPDKPAGRKSELTMCPVQLYSSKNNIQTYQPIKLKDDSDDILQKTSPDLIVVADYGQIIPADMLQYPKFKCLNIHGSLLPDLRGAVPIPIAILKGYRETGVSIPIMTPGMDDGDVIASRSISIEPTDTTSTLKPKLADLGADLLTEILPGWISGKLKSNPQDSTKATYCYMKNIAKKNAEFDSTNKVVEVERMIRAFTPWPIAWCFIGFNGKSLRLKIFRAKPSDVQVKKGEISRIESKLFIGLSDGALELQEIQLEGKLRGMGRDYLYLDANSLLI